MLRKTIQQKRIAGLLTLACVYLAGGQAASAQTSPPPTEKQTVLWMKLEKSILDIDRSLDGVMAAAEGSENVSTPNEMLDLLQALYRGEILNKEMTADFFKVLSTHKDSWIPRNLPDDLKIADKPGALEGVRNDSGVIFVDKRPFVLCVMTTYLHRERDGEEAISNIALAAWGMLDRMARASEYGRVISPGTGSRKAPVVIRQ